MKLPKLISRSANSRLRNCVAEVRAKPKLPDGHITAWIALAAFAGHLIWQIPRLEIGDPALCLRLFKSNRDAGLLLFAGLLADAVMRSAG